MDETVTRRRRLLVVARDEARERQRRAQARLDAARQELLDAEADVQEAELRLAALPDDGTLTAGDMAGAQ